MARTCLRTSWARRMERAWMKFSKHQGLENLAAFHASYTASSVRWSPSAWKNFAFFWSACRGFRNRHVRDFGGARA